MDFQAIPFSKLEKFSPWPRRILGFEPWQQVRNKDKVLQEYDCETYQVALNLWNTEFQHRPHVRPLQFYQSLDKLVAEQRKNSAHAYQNQVISIKDNLFVTDYQSACSFYYASIINTLCKIIGNTSISQVLELGCGNGVNLFNLYEHLPLKQLAGGEISANAVLLGNNIAQKCALPIQFQPFDYYNASDLKAFSPFFEEGDTLLLTCHSIEQIAIKESRFIDTILGLKKPPKLIVHLEPILDLEDLDIHSSFAIKYSELNGYNQDLLVTIKEYQAKNAIEIIQFEKRIFGINAFNPTSLLIWQPK